MKGNEIFGGQLDRARTEQLTKNQLPLHWGKPPSGRFPAPDASSVCEQQFPICEQRISHM